MSVRDLPAVGIRLAGVRKSFGYQVALDGIDLEIPHGSSVALMGPNGAGKTTMLKVVAGLAAPTEGTVTVAGVDMRRAGAGLRALVGYVAHESMLYLDLSLRENLVFHAKLFGIARAGEAAEAAAERMTVAASLDRPVRALSRGMRQRAAIARALLHSPLVLLMDEPYTGLDEAAAASLEELLLELHTPERTMIVTVHEVSRALAGAERLVALKDGRVALDRRIEGDSEELSWTYRPLLGRREVRA
ncbi:MAG: ABC transporter ATP-binding protein [Acidobacteria bacterium]|nr:ABC transporter ATP-binding protein [Acidobacteriota bacterium]